MIGSLIAKLFRKMTDTGASTDARSRNARRFQAGLDLNPLEDRIAPANLLGPAIVVSVGVGLRDMVSVGPPTDFFPGGPTETTIIDADPVDMGAGPILAEGGYTAIS